MLREYEKYTKDKRKAICNCLVGRHLVFYLQLKISRPRTLPQKVKLLSRTRSLSSSGYLEQRRTPFWWPLSLLVSLKTDLAQIFRYLWVLSMARGQTSWSSSKYLDLWCFLQAWHTTNTGSERRMMPRAAHKKTGFSSMDPDARYLAYSGGAWIFDIVIYI